MKRIAVDRPVAAAVLVVCMLLSSSVQAQIYAGSDDSSGAVVLSNFRTGDAATLVEGTTMPVEPVAGPTSSAGVAAAPVASAVVHPSAQMRSLVDAAAARQKLSPALVHAVILAESRYDPRAVSAKGAIGLMQLMPTTGRRFGAHDLFSAEQNVAAGASYLQSLMAQFGGHLDLVLAAYNAGEQAVINAGCRVPAYPETQAYVKGILQRLNLPAVTALRPGTRTGAGCA